MEDEIEYKGNGCKNAKVGNQGRDELGAKIQQREILESNGEGQVANLAQRISDALVRGHFGRCFQYYINQTKSGKSVSNYSSTQSCTGTYILPRPKQKTTTGNQGRGIRAKLIPRYVQREKLAITQMVI